MNTNQEPLIVGDVEVLTPALRAIILYKSVKGVVQLIAGVALFIALALGFAHHLVDVEAALRRHFASGWSARLATILVHYLDAKYLRVGAVALVGDGVLSGVEGWALHKRHWWGPWLVVGASGSLIPFELYEIVESPHVGRIVLLVLNVVVVAYLARRALLEHRERAREAARRRERSPR